MQPRSPIPRTPVRGMNLSFVSSKTCESCDELQKEVKLAKMRAESAFADLRKQMESETSALQTRLHTKETAMLLEQKTLMEEISRLQKSLHQNSSNESEISSRDELIRNLRSKISVDFSAQEISDLQAQVASLAPTNAALTAELHARGSEISSLRSAHSETEAALARLLDAAKISDRRDTAISKAREQVARKKEVAEVERKLAQLEISFARLKIQNRALGQNFSDVQAEARRVVEAKEEEISDLRKLLGIEREEIKKLGERNLSDRLFFEKILRSKHSPFDEVSPVSDLRASVRSRLEESAMLV